MISLLQSISQVFLNSKNHEGSFQPLDAAQYAAYNRYRHEGAKPIFCYLPFNSLTFSMSGNVYVCNYNKNILLGRYPENSIGEIWNGAAARKLRQHMLHNDLEYGCNHCKFYFDKGKFTNLRPLAFDKYHEHTTGDFPRVMEFELSNECNLECQMCNGNVSSSIRKNQDKLPPLPNPYSDEFVAQLEPYIPYLQEAKFYGGEPFLIPVYFKIWERLAAINPSCNIFLITNGSHWNSKIESLLNNLNLDIAISIDSLQKERVEKIRKNVVHEKLMENIGRFNKVLKQKGKIMSLSFTVQQENWMELPAFIHYCNEIETSVYVSYLDSPKQYAISELSKEDLQHIKDTLSKEIFPLETSLQRHNAQCMKDFLTYVEKYIANEQEAQYEDYFYLPENLSAEQKEQLRGRQIIRIKTTATRHEVKAVFENYLNKNSAATPISLYEIMQKIDAVSKVFSTEDLGKMYGMILLADVKQSVLSIERHTIEELVQNTKNQLPLVVVG